MLESMENATGRACSELLSTFTSSGCVVAEGGSQEEEEEEEQCSVECLCCGVVGAGGGASQLLMPDIQTWLSIRDYFQCLLES